jgi:hypothetical protein
MSTVPQSARHSQYSACKVFSADLSLIVLGLKVTRVRAQINKHRALPVPEWYICTRTIISLQSGAVNNCTNYFVKGRRLQVRAAEHGERGCAVASCDAASTHNEVRIKHSHAVY